MFDRELSEIPCEADNLIDGVFITSSNQISMFQLMNCWQDLLFFKYSGME